MNNLFPPIYEKGEYSVLHWNKSQNAQEVMPWESNEPDHNPTAIVVFQCAIPKHRVVVLACNYEEWPVGTILYRGAWEEGEGYEYFNMTREIETDQMDCPSKFNVQGRYLRPATEEEVKIVYNYFERIGIVNHYSK